MIENLIVFKMPQINGVVQMTNLSDYFGLYLVLMMILRGEMHLKLLELFLKSHISYSLCGWTQNFLKLFSLVSYLNLKSSVFNEISL